MDGEERTLEADVVAPFGHVAPSIIIIKGPSAAFASACCPTTDAEATLDRKKWGSVVGLCSDNSGFALESGSRGINQLQK